MDNIDYVSENIDNIEVSSYYFEDYSSAFSPEWLSYQFMQSVCKSVVDLISTYTEAVNKYKDYVTLSDEIGDTEPPEIEY